jgi:DNA-directed RNA polymerase specialized sigma24 family protein
LEIAAVVHARVAATFEPEHIEVRELVVSLKPKQRVAMDLLYFGRCTQAEAAEQLGVPLATVETRVKSRTG